MAGAADKRAIVEDDDEAEVVEAPRKKSKLPLIGGALLILLGAGGGATYYFLFAHHAGKVDKPAVVAARSIYLELSPAFVVNLADSDQTRYLQAEVQVMTHEDSAAEAVKLHMPRIRNDLLMLFSQQTVTGLSTLAGKQALEKAALASVQKVMTQETGKPGVDALYFTSFVMQ
ncbi:MAG TPA: flagellar basal body-associated FliL family protein [Stenotrophobium sp.]|jgi:flagellar FliL protein|nr:flagellar basal body-associated FliL family protein [Stenotrophobium sp.]